MNIKSTNELENGGKLEFEDVFLSRKKKRFIQQFTEKLPTMMYI